MNGLTRKEKSGIIRNVRKNLRQTLKELVKYGCGVQPLCKGTVRRVLKGAGIHRHTTVGVPSLDPKQCRVRLEWARVHVDWTPEDWHRVV